MIQLKITSHRARSDYLALVSGIGNSKQKSIGFSAGYFPHKIAITGLGCRIKTCKDISTEVGNVCKMNMSSKENTVLNKVRPEI